MRKYLNQHNIPLSVAVFLASDTYDHEKGTISATGLMKPIRQSILSSRIPPGEQLVDIVRLVKSQIGTAIHDAIEKAWTNNYAEAMAYLGYPQKVIDSVVINPDPNETVPGTIPVYMEQRSYREIMGFTVSGKYDFVAEGRVQDFKSTSVYTWMSGNKVEDYQLQGSIYRWLNPKIVTDEHLAIQYIFTDWAPGMAKNNPKYPQKPVVEQLIPLLSLPATEAYISNRLNLLRKYQNSPEEDLPFCNDKELWRSDPVYKYYKNPAKKTRSTKNFENRQEAYNRLAADGNVGVVDEVPGQVAACRYCYAFPICKQKDSLIADGSLIV